MKKRTLKKTLRDGTDRDKEKKHMNHTEQEQQRTRALGIAAILTRQTIYNQLENCRKSG